MSKQLSCLHHSLCQEFLPIKQDAIHMKRCTQKRKKNHMKGKRPNISSGQPLFRQNGWCLCRLDLYDQSFQVSVSAQTLDPSSLQMTLHGDTHNISHQIIFIRQREARKFQSYEIYIKNRGILREHALKLLAKKFLSLSFVKHACSFHI